MRRFVAGLLILISAVSLLLASTSLWTRRNVVNTQVFVANVNTIADLPQVEARINDGVTTTVMANPQVQQVIDQAVAILPPRLQQFRPTVQDGVRNLVSAGVQRLLTNNRFRPLTNAAVTSAHDQLVNGQPVQFTLGQAKNLVPASLRDGLAGQVLALLPNDVGVTLLTPADSPQVYNAIDLLESVWWWLGLLALLTLVGALALSRHRRGTLRSWAITSAVFALLLLLTLRVMRGPLITQVKPENRDAVGAVYDVLAGSLRAWTLWLLVIVLVILAGTLLWGHVGLIPAVRRGVASARESVHRRQEAHRARSAASAVAEDLPAGSEAAATTPGEPWYRRLAADTQAFVQGMDLDRRAAALGAFIDAHLRPARWAGIVIGAIVLLLWPSPTLSVLIWIVAVVALYIGLLEWLRSKAPRVEAREAVLEEVAAGEQRAVEREDAGGAARAPIPATPVPPLPVARPPADSIPAPALVGARADRPGTAPSAAAGTRPLEQPVLKPEVLTSLSGRLDLLVRLGQAREAGVLTDEEFAREKERLLAV
jgi:hypothetical protein